MWYTDYILYVCAGCVNGEAANTDRLQGSDTRVHTQKKTRWVFWVDPPKKPANKTHQKNHLN